MQVHCRCHYPRTKSQEWQRNMSASCFLDARLVGDTYRLTNSFQILIPCQLLLVPAAFLDADRRCHYNGCCPQTQRSGVATKHGCFLLFFKTPFNDMCNVHTSSVSCYQPHSLMQIAGANVDADPKPKSREWQQNIAVSSFSKHWLTTCPYRALCTFMSLPYHDSWQQMCNSSFILFLIVHYALTENQVIATAIQG